MRKRFLGQSCLLSKWFGAGRLLRCRPCCSCIRFCATSSASCRWWTHFSLSLFAALRLDLEQLTHRFLEPSWISGQESSSSYFFVKVLLANRLFGSLMGRQPRCTSLLILRQIWAKNRSVREAFYYQVDQPRRKPRSDVGEEPSIFLVVTISTQFRYLHICQP